MLQGLNKTLNRTCILLCLMLSLTDIGFAQLEAPAPSSAEERLKAFELRSEKTETSILNQLPIENVGPTVFSGRVSDIDVNPDDPSIFYVAYASGGLWKTENNGTTFTPLFENHEVITIGDIAVDWKTGTIYLGSGEVNSSRSSYAGCGLYKSTNWGKSWSHIGLEETHHIGRIWIDPQDNKRVVVAALGHLYSPNKERGIYTSIDGGKNWKQSLFVHEDAGAIDLIEDPKNPSTLYAATWERSRRAWNFVESGKGSGIYVSKDAGNSWQQVNNEKSGFPYGQGVGRIGLSAVVEDNKTVLYAVLDNYFRRDKSKEAPQKGLTKDQLRSMDKEGFAKLEDATIQAYLEEFNFPEEYSLDYIRSQMRKGKITPLDLVEYVEDANSLLFDTPVIGAEVYRSTNGGKKWEKTHEGYLDYVYNSYGYYFGQIRTNPSNPNELYIMGVPILRSDDKGKNWTSIWGQNVHADHHALWVNPNRPGHIILGNDGGINISYDKGENWIKCNSPAVGQFYALAVDNKEPYNIYGGLQDNGVWMGSSNYREGVRWHNTGQYPYKEIMGGDGMQVQVDTRTNELVYTGYQFGNYYRIDLASDKLKYITPKHKLGDRPLRWNWQTPIHLSVHNQDILYMGSNKVHRSMNQGDDFEEISPDLTQGGIVGDVAFGTITSLHESPLQFGLLIAGTDDGNIYVSQNGGNQWTLTSEELPQNMWVTKVRASNHKKGRFYATLNAYRFDNFERMIYRTEDYGQTWKEIGLDIPHESVNVITEDNVSEDILYVGTDHGLYISMDGGENFHIFNNGLPAVPVHDLVIHEREKDLLIGTHGRSIYKMSIAELQSMDEDMLRKEIALFADKTIRYQNSWGEKRAAYTPLNIPNQKITAYALNEGLAEVQILWKDLIVYSSSEEMVKGFNQISTDLSLDPKKVKALEMALKESDDTIRLKEKSNGKYYLPKGEYILKVQKDGQEDISKLTIK